MPRCCRRLSKSWGEGESTAKCPSTIAACLQPPVPYTIWCGCIRGTIGSHCSAGWCASGGSIPILLVEMRLVKLFSNGLAPGITASFENMNLLHLSASVARCGADYTKQLHSMHKKSHTKIITVYYHRRHHCCDYQAHSHQDVTHELDRSTENHVRITEAKLRWNVGRHVADNQRTRRPSSYPQKAE